MLGLSRTLVYSGNAGDGRELYANKHFVTITGHGGRGALLDFTDEIVALEQQWFGNTVRSENSHKAEAIRATHATGASHFCRTGAGYVGRRIVRYRLRDMAGNYLLVGVDRMELRVANRPYFGLSKTLHRYDANAVDKLFASFDQSRGITLGTLAHYARQTGWREKPSRLLQMQAPPPSAPHSSMPLLMTADQLRQLPVTPYVVRNVFPAQGLAAVYGAARVPGSRFWPST